MCICQIHVVRERLPLPPLLPPGSWLLLREADRLQGAVLQTVSLLLVKMAAAMWSSSPSVPWGSETIYLPGSTPGACFPTGSPPAESARLPSALTAALRAVQVASPGRRMVLEALLLAHGFEGTAHLNRLMSTLCDTVDELFNTSPLCSVWQLPAVDTATKPVSDAAERPPETGERHLLESCASPAHST